VKHKAERRLPKWAAAVDDVIDDVILRSRSGKKVDLVVMSINDVSVANDGVMRQRSLNTEGDEFVVCRDDVEIYRGPDQQRAWREFNAIPMNGVSHG
jgi:hypothetical protein